MKIPLPEFITPLKLYEWLQDPTSDVVVVDVRDDDYIGGHISKSLHYPSSKLSETFPQLTDKLLPRKKVVFHCLLSQQRGPTAAKRYLEQLGNNNPEQKVYILAGGFSNWQKEYGSDSTVTKNYHKALWTGFQ
ncbi:CDC25-like phosphatase YCH1 [Neolecta irregularis DAH-3]|uniref:CDC25-like phosphatase YCH1 n=1 Tax=Neolecta irregularis (strain DAH-3) TaxID=1198029 RepID=A0A1U7LJG9_NEOID|nr:CDC25-like phosphatase YCH1 [Neolecta irregularis DAH-3]|eukprot:OLL22789.1 CDC25-like phosphatase YCH1 [Neolecta irregularis DAH-3]